MTVVTTPEQTDASHTDIQLTLSWSEAERLRVTLPWLLRALVDRATASPRQRERRRSARAALESLLSALPSQLQPAEEDREGQ